MKSGTTADTSDAEFKIWVSNNISAPSSQIIGGFNLAVVDIWDQGFTFGGYWTDSNDNRDVSWVVDDFQIAEEFDPKWFPDNLWLEEDDPALIYTGTWNRFEHDDSSGGTFNWSDDISATLKFTFEGTGITWWVIKGPTMGKARVYMDGEDMGLIDLYSPDFTLPQPLSRTDLVYGAHTAVIEVSGKQNPNALYFIVNIDALEVVP